MKKKVLSLIITYIAVLAISVFFDYKDSGSYQLLNNAVQTFIFLVLFNLVYRAFFGKWWVNE